MFEEGIFLSSLIIGCVAPSVIILIALCKAGLREESLPSDDRENVENFLDVNTLSNGSSSEEKQESVSESVEKSLSDEKSSETETKNNLERLRRNCNNLLDIFPLEDSDRAGMGSLINDIISSPKFSENLSSKNKNTNDIASFMMQAASSVFSTEERDYIQKKINCLTTLVKTKEEASSLEQNPAMLIAKINLLNREKIQ